MRRCTDERVLGCGGCAHVQHTQDAVTSHVRFQTAAAASQISLPVDRRRLTLVHSMRIALNLVAAGGAARGRAR